MNRARLGSLWPIGLLAAGAGLLLITGVRVSGSDLLDQWYWRNPIPDGNDLNGVAYGNGTFVAVGTGGTITGGNGTPSNTFTAGTPGMLTLNVTVTTSSGCSNPGTRTAGIAG